MKENIIFKPQFNKKLIELGIKTRFTQNFITLHPPIAKEMFKSIYGNANPTLENRVEHLNHQPNWYNFILWGFNWWDALEERAYWEAVALDQDFRSIPICTPSLITFKPEFEEKLHELGIKTRFVRNLREHVKIYNMDMRHKWERLNGEETWYQFIQCGFDWFNAPEDDNYWHFIALKPD